MTTPSMILIVGGTALGLGMLAAKLTRESRAQYRSGRIRGLRAWEDDEYDDDYDEEPSAWQRQMRVRERQMAPTCRREYQKAAKAIERLRKDGRFWCKDTGALERAVRQAFAGDCKLSGRSFARAGCRVK